MTELEFKIIESTSDEKPYFGWFFPRLKKYTEKPSIAVNTIQKLLEEGLIECFHHGEDQEHILYPQRSIEELKNSIENRKWNDFIGMSPKGYEEWEKNYSRFNNCLLDWSKFYCIDYEDLTIKSLSKKVCLEEIKDLKKRCRNRERVFGNENIFDIEDYKLQKIDGFQATYYKYLEGGYCITFSLKPQE